MPTFSNTSTAPKPVITPARMPAKRPPAVETPFEVPTARPTARPAGDANEKRIEHGTITFAEVNFDPAIQRDLEPGLINDIARNWNSSALGVVAISVRNDGAGNESYWSLDGQQRMNGTMRAADTEAGQLRGAHPEWPFAANFYYGLTRAEEAELFLELNNKRSVGAYDKFKNEVLAGHPAAVETERVLRELGIAINQPNGFNSWAMASRVAKMEDGVEHFRWALKLVQDLWSRPGDPANIYDGRVLEALVRMRHRFGGLLKRDLLIEKFNRKGATLAYVVGKGRDKARINNMRAVPALIASITEIYNFSLSEKSAKRLPDWSKPTKEGKASTDEETSAE